MPGVTTIDQGRRAALKRWLAGLPQGQATGTRVLIYHRVGGGSPDERDLAADAFAAQLEMLQDSSVRHLDDALAEQRRGDDSARVVLTFDDGFEDVYHHAWPLLRARRLPFTLYLTTAYVGGTMHWDGSTARDEGGPGLTWPQIREMVDSGLCTIGNHTHTHVRPEQLTTAELDQCSELVERQTGMAPRHFAFTWGVPVPTMATALRERFESAATGRVGSNSSASDPMALSRIPVRGSDPLDFFRAKVHGNLWQERAYGALVTAAKRAGARG
jgi:hypothetical protein